MYCKLLGALATLFRCNEVRLFVFGRVFLERADFCQHGVVVVGQPVPKITVAEFEPLCWLALGNILDRTSQTENRPSKPMAQLNRVHHEDRQQKDHHKQKWSLRVPKILEMLAHWPER